MTYTQSIDVLGLQPNQNYKIRVFATHTNSEGNTEVSDYSPALTIATPSLSGSGTNFSTKNYGTDIQLAGGSLFAGQNFPSNIGQIDLTSSDILTTINGSSGVILNQTGIGAYKTSGGTTTQQFFLDATTGDATFAGTITSPAIQSTNYSASIATSEPLYTQAGMKIDLNNGSISSKAFRITSDGTAYFAGNISGNATINGTPALTVVSNASLGASAYSPAISALQPGSFITKSPSTNEIVTIDTSGITITSSRTNKAAGTNRVEMDSTGFYAYDSTGSPTVQILASGGTAVFKGQITATTGYIGTATDGWQITSNQISAVTSNSSIIGGTIIGSVITTAASSSATRIILNPTTNAVSFYNTGTGVGHITPSSDSGNPGFIFTAGPSSLSSFGGNYAQMLLYTSSLGGGVVNFNLGNNNSFSASSEGVVISGAMMFSNAFGYSTQVRNIRTVSTTNFYIDQQYGSDGEIMLVYLG
jgi:hypothetical protein